jgi:hypothetical protein
MAPRRKSPVWGCREQQQESERVNAKLAEEIHTRAGNSSAAWQSVADDLLIASQVLKERAASLDLTSLVAGDPIPVEGRLGAVELMLKGMAIECLLKALWLKRGNMLIKNGKYVRVRGAGDHDLPQLASAAKFVINDLETDLLRRLSHFIQYGGRYPVPRDAAKLRPTRSLRGGNAPATTWSSPSDGKLFDALVSRLVFLLD